MAPLEPLCSLQNGPSEAFATAVQFRDTQVAQEEPDSVGGTDELWVRRVRKLRQIFNQPASPQELRPVLNALQINEIDRELTRGGFANKKVARIEIAVVEAKSVKSTRHISDLSN